MNPRNPTNTLAVIVINQPGVYLTTELAAARAGITRQAITAAIRRGDLAAVETPWGYLIHENTLAAFQAGRRNPSTTL